MSSAASDERGGSYNTADDPLLADPDGTDDTIGTEDDDVRLTSGSSAIDAGCNAEVPEDDFDVDHDGDTDEALPWDLGRGDRFLDDSGTTDCPYGGSCGTAPIVDMGSYEYLNTNGLLGAPEPPEAGAPGPEPSGTAYIAFAYDALGRRIERTVDSGGASVEVTRYYYAEGPGSAGNGQNVVVETDADEAPRRSFVHGSQYIDERVLMRLPNGAEYYYLPRELYSVAALTDESGAIVEAATYDTYGQVAVYDESATAIPQSEMGNPYYFTGRRLDQLPLAEGLKQAYHYRARAYDPGNGRFVQRDPLEYFDGPNLYESSSSSPTVYVDPSGKVGEVAVCAWRWYRDCRACVQRLLPRARSLLQAWINENGNDSCQVDAMQHCIAQGLVRKDCGWSCAYGAGTANEKIQGDAENERDHARDYHNNAEGRDCGGGEGQSENGVVTCCQEKLRNGTLDTGTDHPDGRCP